jgi:hypothetical protein
MESYGKIIIRGRITRAWNKAVVVYFNVGLKIRLETGKPTQNLTQVGRDWKRRLRGQDCTILRHH